MAAARKKIDALLARVVAGEDMAKLAVLSDDPGSAQKGGAYPGLVTRNFVTELRHAYEELKPGTFTHEPLRSTFGWHIVAKEAVDEASTIESYKYATAVQAAEKMADLLRTRLRHVGPEGVDAVLSRTCAEALNAECGKLPTVSRLPADAPAGSYATSCKDLLALARGGTRSRTDLDWVRVATLTDDPPGPTEVEGGACSGESETRLRAMVEKIRELQSKAQPLDTTGWAATPTRSSRLFEIVQVDDTRDAIRAVTEASLANGVEILSEDVPSVAEPHKPMRVHFARFDALPGEPLALTRTRAQRWLATVRHPKGTFFAIEQSLDQGGTPTGYRSFLANDRVIVDDRDIAKARPALSLQGGEPMIQIELRPEGAKRFAEGTRDWINRRIAVLVDGVIGTTPIVKAEITGGRLEFHAPGETLAKRMLNAERIARSLERR